MYAWILDESPGSYRWGEMPDPEPGPDDVVVSVVTSALNHMDLWLTRGMPKPPLPHIPGCDVGGGRACSGRRCHERRDRRRGRGQSGRLTGRRDHRLGQRQPDGSRFRHLGRARPRRSCQLRHRPRPQHRPPPTEPHVGGVRGLPALLPDGLADAAPGPARCGRHPPGRGYRRRGRHRRARPGQGDGRARLRHVARSDQARPRDRARSRRRVRLSRIEVAGHARTSSSRAWARRRGSNRCARSRPGAGSCCVEAPRGCRSS